MVAGRARGPRRDRCGRGLAAARRPHRVADALRRGAGRGHRHRPRQVAAGGAAAARRHPLWSSFVWRNELADTFVEVVAAPWFARAVTGTPLLTVWFRMLGSTVGRGVWCETYWLPEADLVELGDGATVNQGSVVQTHLFHDRMLNTDVVRLGAGATLGPNSVILPAASIGTARYGRASVTGHEGGVRAGQDDLDRQSDRAMGGPRECAPGPTPGEPADCRSLPPRPRRPVVLRPALRPRPRVLRRRQPALRRRHAHDRDRAAARPAGARPRPSRRRQGAAWPEPGCATTEPVRTGWWSPSATRSPPAPSSRSWCGTPATRSRWCASSTATRAGRSSPTA